MGRASNLASVALFSSLWGLVRRFAEQMNDPPRKALVDFSVTRDGLINACHWIAIPIMLRAMTHKNASKLLNRANKINALHGRASSPI
jgi:hypothetical protein